MSCRTCFTITIELITTLAVAALAAALVVFIPADASALTAADGWDALWANDCTEAEVLFRQAIEEDKDDPAAWRGLLFTHLLLGRDEHLAENLENYARRSRGEPCDWYLAQMIDKLTGVDSKAHYESLHKFVKRLADNDDLPPIDRRVLLDQQANYAYLCGKPDEAADLARELGRVRNWSVLGPFDNVSGAGHSRQHIDDWDPKGIQYTGKYGQQIGWNTPALVGLDRNFVASRYFAQEEETTAYLRTVVDLEHVGRYVLSLSHSGDIELWVDGEHLFSGSRKNSGQEIAHWELSFSKGPHLLAAKLSNRENESQIGVGICRRDGEPARLECQPRAHYKAPSSPDLDAHRLLPSFQTALVTQGERALGGAGNPEDLIWMLAQAQHTAEPDSVMHLCERIEEAFPDQAPLWLMCGQTYLHLGEADQSRRAFERAGELDAGLMLPRIVKSEEDLNKKRYDAVIEACEVILAEAPACYWALSLKLQALLGRQDLDELERRARKLTKELDDQPLGWDFLAQWAAARGMQDERRDFESQALRRRRPLERHFQRFFEESTREDYGEVKKAIKDLLNYVPDMAGMWGSLVESQVADTDYDDAFKTLDKALASFPQDVQLLYWKALFAEGNAYWDRGHEDGQAYAAMIIKDALNFAPGSLPLRDKHRTLAGLTPYREYLADPDLGAILERRVDSEQYPGARAVVLQEWKRRLFFDDDISMLDYSVAVQLVTKAGVEAWKEFQLGAGASSRTLVDHKTVKPDGTEIEATLYGNSLHFENLEPGDVAVLRYQSTQFQGEQLRGHAWDHYHFAFGDPCLESRYELIGDADLEVQVQLHNQDALDQSVKSEEKDLGDGFQLRRWVLRDIPAHSSEANATHGRSYLPWLDVSTVPDWQVIAGWYADLAHGQAEVTRPVLEKAQELCVDVSDPEEKIERIYRFVSQDIHYMSVPFYMSAHVPRKAEEVLKSRYGDCKDKSCLMIALLGAVGVDDVRFALIDSWGARAVQMLPSPRFNHAIVCRRDGAGGYRWYDPTIKYGTSRQIPDGLVGGLALVADAATQHLTSIEGDPIDVFPSRVRSQVVLHNDGSASIHRLSEDIRVDKTVRQRAGLENLMPDELREDMLENIAVGFPGAVLETLIVRGRADVDSALVYDVAFDAPQLFRDSGGFLVGQLPWARRLSTELNRMVAKTTRQSPIDLHRLRACEIETVTLVLPEDVTVMELPQAQDLRFGNCRYVTTYSQEGRQLHIRSETVFDGDRVYPSEYAEFKGFVEAVLQDQDLPLLLRREG